MRLRRLVETISDYQCEKKYHLAKANVVVDALSCKAQTDLPSLLAGMRNLLIRSPSKYAILTAIQEIILLIEKEILKGQQKDHKT